VSTRYLQSIEDLRENAAADLGQMDAKGYDDFMREARGLAAGHGITRLKLVIDVKFKEANGMGVTEQPFPVREEDWDAVLEDARTLCEYIPHVFLVDGNKFSIPI
jgi:hypothetical protein